MNAGLFVPRMHRSLAIIRPKPHPPRPWRPEASSPLGLVGLAVPKGRRSVVYLDIAPPRAKGGRQRQPLSSRGGSSGDRAAVGRQAAQQLRPVRHGFSQSHPVPASSGRVGSMAENAAMDWEQHQHQAGESEGQQDEQRSQRTHKRPHQELYLYYDGMQLPGEEDKRERQRQEQPPHLPQRYAWQQRSQQSDGGYQGGRAQARNHLLQPAAVACGRDVAAGFSRPGSSHGAGASLQSLSAWDALLEASAAPNVAQEVQQAAGPRRTRAAQSTVSHHAGVQLQG